MFSDIENFQKFIRWYFKDSNLTFDIKRLLRYRQFIEYKNTEKNTNANISFLELEMIRLAEARKEKLLNLLCDLAIPEIILLKSSALNHHYFKNSLIRASSDIDILVDYKNYRQLKLALSSFSVKVEKDNRPFSTIYEETWYCEKFNCYIDLHYYLLNPLHYNILTEDIFSQSIEHRRYKNNKIRVPSLEHMIIHLLLHYIKDGKLVSQSVFDYLYIKMNYDINEDKLESYLDKWECRKAYALSCSLITQTIFDDNLEKSIKLRLIMSQGNLGKLIRLTKSVNIKNLIKTLSIYFAKLVYPK